MLEKTKKYLNKELSSFKYDDILELQDIITHHNDLYYNKENPIISDYEYDSLFKKLKTLEEDNELENYITKNVGAELVESTFQKVKHSRPMISLDNTYNEDDLNDFNTRVLKNIDNENIELKYTLEFKFDGLGVELIYKDGKLIQAITRGNGIEGEDVTQNILQIENIPKTINYRDNLEVRGEVVMPISSFERLNQDAKKTGEKIFSNPRNAASGSIRMKDNRVTKKRSLKFFAYDLANFDEFRLKESIEEYYDVIKDLEKLGFEISSYFKKLDGIKEVIDSIKNFGDLKSTLDFEIDGLVLKVNDISLWKTIGFTEHHPRYAIAYKFPAEILTTKIISVDHQVGRTGTITPVANLEPINIGGVMVKRATLHNYDEVRDLDVRVGDSVFIKRAGEVIPKIISVIDTQGREKLEKITPPVYCPSCETKVLKDNDKVRYYCPNNVDCPAKHHEKLTFAVSKQGFNIDGLGERQIATFLKEGIINNLIDVFRIEEKRDQILELEGFKEKSVQNLIESVQKAKNINITTFLTALGIPGVGKKTSKTLSKLIKSSDSDFLKGNIYPEELINLDDIGPEIATNIIDYFNNDAHRRIIDELLDILNIEYYKETKIEKETIFYGKKVCITGSFIVDGKKISRDELIEKLEKVGGSFVSSVSKNTDFLIAGEKAGSKLKKANELGVQVFGIDEFLSNL